MQISVFGRTDKRTCIYTLMKILQPMGDVLVVTNNPYFKRLVDGESDGFYQNIRIFVIDTTADEFWYDIGHSPEDFEYVILDNLFNESTDLTIYIQGAGKEAGDEDLFEAIEDMKVIHMGHGKNAVPFSGGLMSKLEHIEYYKKLVAPSNEMLNILAKFLSEKLNLPVKNIVKVGSKP